MLLKDIGKSIKEIQDGGKLAVISDENVAALYLDTCVASLEEEGFQVVTFVIPPGENSKSGEMFIRILDFLAEVPLTRTDGIVALGGGIVGDLAGFTAASFLRGIKVIQVPTTLLAAVDSSVGGKTAINLKAGKNLAGAFHQPALVYQDAELLKSLPENIFRDGMAEVIKYGIIADGDFFDSLEDTDYVQNNIEAIVRRCVEIKQKYVDEDEFDMGVRHMLNFGHTIAHAIEKLSNYEISHGSAVAIGMDQIAQISMRKGWCDNFSVSRIRNMILRYGFDIDVPFPKDQIIEVMKSDKKRENNTIDIVVPEHIGKCRLQRMNIDELDELLK